MLYRVQLSVAKADRVSLQAWILIIYRDLPSYQFNRRYSCSFQMRILFCFRAFCKLK